MPYVSLVERVEVYCRTLGMFRIASASCTNTRPTFFDESYTALTKFSFTLLLYKAVIFTNKVNSMMKLN